MTPTDADRESDLDLGVQALAAVRAESAAEIAALRAELSKAIDRHEADSKMLAAAHDVCERKDREIERLTARVQTAEASASHWREGARRWQGRAE